MANGETFERYFKEECRAAGWDAEVIYWSLGYCQGDHVEIRKADGHQDRLIERLGGGTPTEEAAHLLIHGQTRRERLVDLDAVACVRDGMVSVEQRAFGDHELRAGDEELLEAFEEAARAEVEDLERRLQSDGYKIREATEPFWFSHGRQTYEGASQDVCVVRHRTYRTREHVVVVDLLEDGDWNGYESGDVVGDHADMKRIVAGEWVAYAVRVRILERDELEEHEEGAELAEASLWGIVDDKDLRYSREVRAELLAQCRADLGRPTRREVACAN
jgi:hypothetical protein